MRTNQTKWILAACFAVALAGVGCGDDDGGDDPVAGTGGGGGGGTGGATSGTGGGGGGRGGTGGTAGGGSNVQACITATVAKITADRMACATCVCEKGTALATACANSAQCWPLISCVGSSGCAATDITCITNACGAYLDGAGAAQPFGTPIVTGMCSAQCVTDDDGGMEDAGI